MYYYLPEDYDIQYVGKCNDVLDPNGKLYSSSEYFSLTRPFNDAIQSSLTLNFAKLYYRAGGVMRVNILLFLNEVIELSKNSKMASMNLIDYYKIDRLQL